ncbi:hypothetical protein [Fundicoccus culcitae]|uniref:ABC transporter permease n=1 Tax=Fundicoccus culcitae TaxID=2969821 RepID=A0ABY5P6W3_9LACT|nr:hypothetical protein [Fundicoccus culcitae]UUX34476.1 hypothetical protein NRE15_02160 [Fundicoccus culcitae]
MSYVKYVFKLSFKNKLNFIPILLPIIIILFFAIMNSNASENTSYINSINQEVQIMSNLYSDYQNLLENETLSEEDFEGISIAADNLRDNLNLSNQSIEYAKNGNWTESLTLQLQLLQDNVLSNIENGSSVYDESYVRSMYNRKATYEILAENNIEPEFSGIEIKGFTFTFRMMDILFPAILTTCLIALLSNIFGGNLVDRMDIEDMFPVNQVKWQISKILLCFFICFILCMIWYGVSLLVSTLLNGPGSLNYPINIFSDSYIDTLPLSLVISKTIILQILSILFLVSTVYLISILVKNQLSTLFISTVLLVGPILLTGNIAPLSHILHLLPTTYFNATRVITNQLAFENNNVNISFYTGIYVLLLSSIIMLLAILILKKYHETNQLFHKAN